MKMRTENVYIVGCEAKYNQKGEPYLLVRVDDGTGKVEVFVDKDMSRQAYYQRGVVGTMFFNVTLGRYTNIRIIDFKQTNTYTQPQPQPQPQQYNNYNNGQQFRQYGIPSQQQQSCGNDYYNAPQQQLYDNNYYNNYCNAPQQPYYNNNYYNTPPQPYYNTPPQPQYNYNMPSQQTYAPPIQQEQQEPPVQEKLQQEQEERVESGGNE